ncbi:MAG: hypothetical protein E7213_01900 [Clostridium sp.]|nr:hypothetical protein [Clostridium sp.]
MLLKYLIRFLLVIIILILLYLIIDLFREILIRGYILGIWSKVQDKYEERQRKRKTVLLLEGEHENKSVLERVDILIERAQLKRFFPFLTSEILIVVTLIVAFLISFLVYKFFQLMIFAIPVFFLVIMFTILLLQSMCKITYDKIDEQVLIYINILENLAASNGDIVTIMEKSIPYLKEPLKTFTTQFVFECKKGIELDEAFKNFQNKIESKRLKQLLINLQVSSKFKANYKDILSKSRVIMKNYFSEKERRKKEVREGRIAIISILILEGFLVKLVSGFIPNLFFELKNNLIGNIILEYNFFVIMFAIYKFITLGKMNN